MFQYIEPLRIIIPNLGEDIKEISDMRVHPYTYYPSVQYKEIRALEYYLYFIYTKFGVESRSLQSDSEVYIILNIRNYNRLISR